MRRLSLIKAIIEKDFLDSLKNRTVIFSILFPVVLSLLFRVAMSGGEMAHLKVAVVCPDKSGFVNFLNKSTFGYIQAEKNGEVEEAKRLVMNGSVSAAIILPDRFEEMMKSGKTPKVDFWVDGANISKGAVMEVVINRMLFIYGNQAPPAELVIKNVQGAGFRPQTAAIPTWLLFTILGGFMVVASSIIEERDKKTLQAILVTPCRLEDVLIGKGFLGFMLTVAAAFIILALNDGFTGNVFLMTAVILTGSAFFAILGVFMGIILPGQMSANSAGSILYIIMFMPVILSDGSRIMKAVAQVLPSFYVFQGVNEAMFKTAASSMMVNPLILAVLSIILFAGSVIALKKKENL